MTKDSVAEAAKLMKNENIGSIPIVENKQNQKLVGIVTDRDLALTIVATRVDEPAKTAEMIKEISHANGK